MPPDSAPFDPQRILEVLARHHVECVVIGGYAAVLAGIDVVTRDIDITPATDQANLERLAGALDELHAAIRVPHEPAVPLPADPRRLARAQILNLTTDDRTRPGPARRHFGLITFEVASAFPELSSA